MFLIDSSAWIEYFRPKGSLKVKERVRETLEKENAVCCGIVVVEILRGSKDNKTFHMIKETLLSLPQIPINNTVIEKAAQWGFMLAKKRKTVPTTDLLIGSASDEKAIVLHIDSDFETIASITGLGQEKIAVTS